MTTETYNRPLRRIVASEGHTITRKDYNAEHPYFTPVVYLGAGDSEDNYMEVTVEEAERIMLEATANDEQQTANDDERDQ